MTAHTLTRADLAEAVYGEIGLPRSESARLVEDVIDILSDLLVAGETAKISSFGNFTVREKGPRLGRNPKTGQEVPIEPRRSIVFRPSVILRQRVNAGNPFRAFS